MPRHGKLTGDSDPVSHNEELYFKELEELFTPYTEDEIRLHTIDRELKNAVEERHARNYRLIEEAQRWISFLYHDGPKPKINIGDVILEEIKESKASNLAKPVKVFCLALKEYGSRMMPHIRVVTYCSRSTATLYQLLDDIHTTPELRSLVDIERQLFALLTNQGEHFDDASDYTSHINHLYSRYLALASTYGSQLSAFIVEAERDFKLRINGNAANLTATVGDVKRVAQTETIKIISAVKKATGEKIQGCHHRNKAKDKIVQQVIQYLSKPNITFSIHNACKIIAPDEGSWLYDWCHAHETDILTSVELRKTQIPN